MSSNLIARSSQARLATGGKWGLIAAFPPDEIPATVGRRPPHLMGLKILWIKTSPLHPLTRGGDLRSFHMLRCLQKHHRVVYAGLASGTTQWEGTKQSPLYSSEAHWTDHRLPEKSTPAFMLGAARNALFSQSPYAATRFRSNAWEKSISAILKRQAFDLLICDFLFPSASLPWEQLRSPGSPALLLFQHNVESQIWQRRAENSSELSRPYWREQWKRMERFEGKMSRRFDGVVAVSEDDADIFRRRFELDNVIGHVATGVDGDHFQTVPRLLDGAPKIVFLGSMDWHANIDAVQQFVAHSWPVIRAAHPTAIFQIVGRDPSPAVRQLADSNNGIEVTGTVADVRPWLRNAHVMVVPLRIGGGTRIKIFESMAAEVPVVSTRIGAEGLPVEDERDLLLADDPASFAGQVIRVINNPDFARQLAENARTRVLRDHTWEAVTAGFEEYCRQTIARAKP
ncbi:MAG: glycosyltransferase [Verrucomicrobiaceae bacterium]|nr:MAG: glycosyltransferase [Verrucomicrobiaceae bacterium]